MSEYNLTCICNDNAKIEQVGKLVADVFLKNKINLCSTINLLALLLSDYITFDEKPFVIMPQVIENMQKRILFQLEKCHE